MLTNDQAIAVSQIRALHEAFSTTSAELIRENHKVVKGSKAPPYFQLIEMPWVGCEAPVFEHVPIVDKRFRGAGRLASMATNTTTEDNYYVTFR